MPLVGEAHRDAVIGEGSELLDEAVVELLGPFACQERDDLIAAPQELRPVSPITIRRVGERDTLGITGVPAVLGAAYLLDGGLARERR